MFQKRVGHWDKTEIDKCTHQLQPEGSEASSLLVFQLLNVVLHYGYVLHKPDVADAHITKKT